MGLVASRAQFQPSFFRCHSWGALVVATAFLTLPRLASVSTPVASVCCTWIYGRVLYLNLRALLSTSSRATVQT